MTASWLHDPFEWLADSQVNLKTFATISPNVRRDVASAGPRLCREDRSVRLASR